jgi:8-oxo-dGTP pyrophosphatase MutT (NUDIX family)
MSGLAERLRRSFAAHADDESEPFVHYRDLVDDIANLKIAAVLVPIIDAPEPRILLTVRREDMRSHAGQVAFPGGRLDPEDDGPIEGALREAWEEIGLPPDRVDVIGTARAYATGSGYLITPVVGVIPEGLELVPHEAEVARVFEVPLDHLVTESNHLRRSAVYNEIERHYYEIDWPHEYIWGVTAGLIVNLAPRLREAIGSAA